MKVTTKSRNRRIAMLVGALVIFMLILAYAAVPFYSLFCKVTGFGGTTQIAEGSEPHAKGSRAMTVRFDANVEPGLSWKFVPQQVAVHLRTGEHMLAFYEAENTGSEAVTGVAMFNVTPSKAGEYFHKIHCFCFEEQRLEAGQKVIMPVSFYLDPALETDPAMKGVDTITLSYSFFRVAQAKNPE
jgi:cytochrome c oxidase assembly protein subunit 11